MGKNLGDLLQTVQNSGTTIRVSVVGQAAPLGGKIKTIGADYFIFDASGHDYIIPFTGVAFITY